MTATAAVLICALDLLGKAAKTLPPVKLVAIPPTEASRKAEGFVRPGDATIYVVTSSPAYREADCRKPWSLIKLASVIMHEDWHIRNGSDERGAYEAQLHTLLKLGAKPESPVYRGVLKSMQAVLKERKRDLLAARRPEDVEQTSQVDAGGAP